MRKMSDIAFKIDGDMLHAADFVVIRHLLLRVFETTSKTRQHVAEPMQCCVEIVPGCHVTRGSTFHDTVLPRKIVVAS